MRALLLSTALIGLAGCTPPKAVTDRIADVNQTADAAVAAQRSRLDMPVDGVQIASQPYYGRTTSTRRPGQYDPVLSGRIEVTTDAAATLSLAEVARRIEMVAGIPVHLDQSERLRPTAVSAANPPAAAAPLSPVAVASLMQSMTASSIGQARARGAEFSYRFSGTIRDFLALVAAQHGVEWEVRTSASGNKAIHIFDRESRTWTIAAPNGTSKTEAGLANESTSDKSGQGRSAGQVQASSKLTQSISYDTTLWQEIEEQLKGFSSESVQLTISPSTWTVTAKGAPAAIREIDRYITELNDRLTRQIDMQVTVYSVTMQDSEDFALNLDLAMRSLGDDLRLASSSPITGIAAAAASVTGLVSETSGPTRALQGTKLVVKALSKLGRTSVAYQRGDTVQSGTPITFQDVDTNTYVASVAPANQSTNGTTATSIPVVTPGQTVTGLKLLAMPRALGDGSIHLGMMISESAVVDLRSIAQGQGTSIEAPRTAGRDSPMKYLFLPSGGTSVYMYYVKDRAESEDSAPTSNTFSRIFGGRVFGNRERTVMVVTVSATITPRPITQASAQ